MGLTRDECRGFRVGNDSHGSRPFDPLRAGRLRRLGINPARYGRYEVNPHFWQNLPEVGHPELISAQLFGGTRVGIDWPCGQLRATLVSGDSHALAAYCAHRRGGLESKEK